MVSIIVPVYNTEKYLRQCVESVLTQTYSDWELILVDDGSFDGSEIICDEYARSDSRIRAIHRPNGGLSVARNTGLDYAQGEWLSFLDSDDLLHPQFLETLLTAKDPEANIATCDFRNFCELPVLKPISNPKVTTTDSHTFLKNLLYQTQSHHSMWGKIFNRDIFKTLRFTPGILYEDLDIIPTILLQPLRVSDIHAKLYLYRYVAGSLIHTFSYKRLVVLDITDRILARNLDNEELSGAARSRRLAAHFNILFLMRANRFTDKPTRERCIKIITQDSPLEWRNPQARLKNRITALLTPILGIRLLEWIGGYIFQLKRK